MLGGVRNVTIVWVRFPSTGFCKCGLEKRTFWMAAYPTRPPFTQGLSCLGLYFFPSLLLQFFLSLFWRRVACTTWQLKIEDASEIICGACWISATAVWYSTNRILIFMQLSSRINQVCCWRLEEKNCSLGSEFLSIYSGKLSLTRCFRGRRERPYGTWTL